MPYSKNPFRYPDQFHDLVDRILPQVVDEIVITFEHKTQAFKVRNQLIAFRNSLRFEAQRLLKDKNTKKAEELEANARLFDAFSIHVLHSTKKIINVQSTYEQVNLIIRRRNFDTDILTFEQQINQQFDNLLTNPKTVKEELDENLVSSDEIDKLAKVLGAMNAD